MTRVFAALVACVCVAGCSGIGVSAPPDGPGSARTPSGEPLAPRAAMERIVVGKSTKAEVSASIGKPIVVPFDSGYEVWLYRWPAKEKSPRGATEVVVLFDPAGVATKLRLRPGS